MDDERSSQLWKILGELRDRERPDLVSWATAAAEQVGPLTFADLRHIAGEGESGYYFVPDSLLDAIAEIVQATAPHSVLDPCAGVGSLIIPLAKRLGASNAVGIYQSTTAHQLASLVAGHEDVQWIQGDPIQELPKLPTSFDLIVSNPPVEQSRIGHLSLPTPQGVIRVTDQIGLLGILLACTRLTSGGTGVFILPASFVRPDRSESVYSSLTKLGFRLDAVLAPPLLFQSTYLSFLLAIVRRDLPGELFVGELSADPVRNAVLINNLKNRRQGKELELGRLVDPLSFRSYAALQMKEKADDLAGRSGLDSFPLADIASEINLATAMEPPGFVEKPNAVYLPLIGRGDALVSIADVSTNQQNYAQIVLNPRTADAAYVAGFLNSPLGRMVREQLYSGTLNRKITRAVLCQATVYLPPLRTQLEVLGGITRIQNLVNELESLRQQLWSKPRQAQRIVRQIEKVNREDRFESWLDCLPYPLATILWTYHSNRQNPKEAYDHLTHFFEALAEFHAAVLLSGFSTNSSLFESERQAFLRGPDKGPLDPSLATFGLWVNIVGHLSSTGRKLLNNLEKRESVEQMFGTSRRDFLEVLFSSELVGHLQDANSHRNTWTGHVGIVNEQTAQERKLVLEGLLSKVRSVLGDAWQNCELVKPGSGRFDGESYEYTVCQVMGSRYPFESKQVKVAEPLKYGELYLLGSDSRHAIELIPLVRLGRTPEAEQNACYFYNRVERAGIRFISYHYADQPEIMDHSDHVAAFIKGLAMGGQMRPHPN